jgi:hypothetical protein
VEKNQLHITLFPTRYVIGTKNYNGLIIYVFQPITYHTFSNSLRDWNKIYNGLIIYILQPITYHTFNTYCRLDVGSS